ncbi:hypothetical protein GCM10010912_25680 [Paenibacillus albidus]|uniref:Response regulator transcription factor n=1 Tax=Paenibacillus albidus TaxID=2041023 RepID=A0A917C9V7_9BACL|nr:response regulator [Paenibacillus albidus]GGF79550.1 hypothetical protein GCM10010912_25680 [Paenibacillus albidus]
MWTIAIIDDDRQVLQGMKRAIPWEELDAGWVGEAMNGMDGLEMIRSTQPDIVITDIYMPVMNGLDMIERLRDTGFCGKIIILSGYADFEYARQALRLNVCDYISKPVSMPTLKAILGKALHELSEEVLQRNRNEELQQKLELYQPFVEKEWIKAAITGTLKNAYLSTELPEPYLFWAETGHIVVGLELVREIRACELNVSDWHLFKFALGNIVCEVAGSIFPYCEYSELHGGRSALVLHPSLPLDSDTLNKQLEMLGMQLIDCVRRYIRLVIRVGIGASKEQWQNIPDSMEEAFQAIELKQNHIVGGYSLYVFRDGKKHRSNSAVMRPVKFYHELASALKTSQEAQARQIIAEFKEKLERLEGVAPDYLQLLAGELWGIFAYSLYEVGMLLDNTIENGQLAQEMAGLITPQQLAEWLTAKIEMICSSRQWLGSSKHRQAVDFITQYIHENYMNEITLGELADKVYLSRNHLAIIFKKMTGDTFNTYLTRVRIEKSKELLIERHMLVYEVAEQVGYKNVPYFSTLFKKYTGMNPTELIR